LTAVAEDPPRAVVVGVGNRFRRDDGAGPAVVDRLAGRLPESVEAVEVPGGAAEVLAAFDGCARAVLVDAMTSGAPPGLVRRFDAAAGPLPAGLGGTSTHGLGAAEAVELARALGRLPRALVVFGIEGADFGEGEGLTPAVAAAVARVAEEVARWLGRGP
jgi:hydrogenase maturation protease